MNEQTKNHKPVARRVLRILLVVLAVVLAVHITLQWLNLEVYYQQHGQVYELSNRFDLDDEASVPTWVAQALFLAIAAAAGVAAWLARQIRERFIWGLVSIVGLVLSIDEIATLHEFTLQTLHVIAFGDNDPSLAANAWLLILPVVVALGGLLVWTMYKVIPQRTLFLFVVSGLVFLVGAIGVDMVAETAFRESFLNQGIFIGLEEGMELLAKILVLYAIVDYIEKRHAASFRKALAELKD